MNGWLLAGTTFLASGVEAVEAMTIVLAVGVARSWRVAFRGAGLGLLVLAAIVAVFGPLLHFVPLAALKLAIGVLLALFGLAWLRKAILRYAGRKALRDEDANYEREVERAARGRRSTPGKRRPGGASRWRSRPCCSKDSRSR